MDVKRPAFSSPSSLIQCPQLSHLGGLRRHGDRHPRETRQGSYMPLYKLRLSPTKPFSTPWHSYLTRPLAPGPTITISPCWTHSLTIGNLSLSPDSEAKWSFAQDPGQRGFGAGSQHRARPLQPLPGLSPCSRLLSLLSRPVLVLVALSWFCQQLTTWTL